MLKYKKSVYVLIVIAIILLSFMLGILTSDVVASNVDAINKERKVNVSTSISQDEIVLKETNVFCPFCGIDSVAINNEIVCRNEDCEVYGLPVRISKCDGSMNWNCEYYNSE